MAVTRKKLDEAASMFMENSSQYLSSQVVGIQKEIRESLEAAKLTGIGDDGAKGMLEMREAGAGTIAQDESS
jgi:chemotaxis response regulator CheB